MRRCHHGHHCQLAAAAAGCALCLPAVAHGGANLVYDGGTPAEQAQVTAALGASSFDWNVLRDAITVHIAPLGLGGYATSGNVYLDSALLDGGEFSWGVVQHEFGHQVDFLLLHEDERARLEAALGAKDWCYEVPGLSHADHGCERFASELAWAYWPSPENSMHPSDIGGESDAMPPAAFRALVAQLLHTPDVSTLVHATPVVTAPVTGQPTPVMSKAAAGSSIAKPRSADQYRKIGLRSAPTAVSGRPSAAAVAASHLPRWRVRDRRTAVTQNRHRRR